jgi:hypothetical protein
MGGLLQQYARGWLARLAFACIACAGAGAVSAAAPEANSAASLRARFTALSAQPGPRQFQRPLFLDSVESSRDLKGDIFALVDYPFAAVDAALNGPAHWCDVLILHINTKYCTASTNNAGTVLTVNIGKKVSQPLVETSRVEFAYRVAAATPDYFAVHLYAATGPLSTSDYHILLEAASLEGGKTIAHLTYSYAFGVAGRLAMQAYLATVGRGKVGFTIVGTLPNGAPDYIGGVRSVVERNTMRYFLAIDAYLAALAVPPPEQLEKRLQNWYNSTEAFARQLHDVDRIDYLDMKRREYQRQQAAQQTLPLAQSAGSASLR